MKDTTGRACNACHKKAHNPLASAPDHCLGWLPEVKFACCGHGFIHHAYVTLNDGTILRGAPAQAWMKAHGGEPPVTTSTRSYADWEELWPLEEKAP